MTPKPWTIEEVNQILASAKAMPGIVGGVPGHLWWPALLLTLLDTASSVSDALVAEPTAYRRSDGTLAFGPYIFRLHPHTVEALDTLPLGKYDRLLPWPFDNGTPPFLVLHGHYRRLLHRAGLPHTAADLFKRIRVTATRDREILSSVDLSVPFTPEPGEPSLDTGKKRGRKSKHAAPDTPEKGTLRCFFEGTYLPIRLLGRGAKASTVAHYRWVLSAWHRLIGDSPIEQIDDASLARFAGSLLDEQKSIATVNNYLSHVQFVLRFAGPRWQGCRDGQGLLSEVPYFASLREPQRVPRIIPQADLPVLYRATGYANLPLPDRFGPHESAESWWSGLFTLLYNTGLRIGAATEIGTDHVNWQEAEICLPVHLSKTRAERIVPLNQAALEVISPLRGNAVFFPWYHSRAPLFTELRRIQRRAGIYRPYQFHDFRRTFCTLVAELHSPQAAQLLLGHSSFDVTAAHYLSSKNMLREAVNRIAPSSPSCLNKKESNE